MARYARHLQTAAITNPFPGIVTLERMLGFGITERLGSNEGLPFANQTLLQDFGAEFCELARLYPDPSALALRECVAAQQRLSVDEILFDAGADSLLLLALRTYCSVGDVVVTSAGTYPSFRYFAEGVGAQLIEVPYFDFNTHDQSGRLAPDLAALAAQARASQATLVYLANPDNPTGYYHDREAIRRFRDALPEQTALILDEAYIDFCPADSSLPASATCRVSTEYTNTVRLRTLSKAYAAAGLRLGYAMADAEWVKKAAMVRVHFAISNVTQAAGLTLLTDVAYMQQMVERTLLVRQELGKRLHDACGQQQVLPSATNFVAIRYPDPRIAAAIQQSLWQKQIAVHRPSHPAVQQLLRVTAHPSALDDSVLEILASGSTGG